MPTKQIKSPTLTAIDQQVKAHLKGRNYSDKQYDAYLITVLCAKVAELEGIIQDRG